MTSERIHALLVEVAAGRMTVEEASRQLSGFPVALCHQDGEVVARLDTQRAARHGFPEVILAQGKRFAHLEAIVERALSGGEPLLITRLTSKRIRRLKIRFPALTREPGTDCLFRVGCEVREPRGLVGVLCAGTSDIGVAREAALVARLMGARVQTHFDAGVAGLHRLLAADELLRTARVFVVVAGMEGALPSVVGGLVNKPVIAVPTSAGYGAAFGGLTALLGMLNSCAANVTVVNIDNGFGAGYVAGLINRL
ncbi:Pyridinium-3,5-biscarboxylic acid mononucleotide synthase [Candidatus Magnetaquicoccaceae bacterium FCR-1]|uniref:Pyridinium-3,5-biscarboxylic acid mononucleotide synthase n=1 Tax=Candidatus Magnetaquiglobus chichijimensis TaxID=3141448 RepID=A0ABQ0C5Q8_9PROT